MVGGVNYLFTTTTVQPWANQSAHVGRDVTENGVTGSDVIEAKCNLVVGCEGREERGEGREERALKPSWKEKMEICLAGKFEFSQAELIWEYYRER